MLIWLYLRHIKVYKNIKYIPIWYEHNFVSYVWENWIGKSTILEALDSFFNWKRNYIINNWALDDWIWGGNNPYILPIFLIDKQKITRNKKEFEFLSDFFWNIEKEKIAAWRQWSMKDFFELREKVIDKKDSHFLILLWETNFTWWYRPYFWSFNSDENFIKSFLEEENIDFENDEDKDLLEKKLNECLNNSKWKRILQELKNLYSYVYIPVEIDVESFTKIETDEMQKIFGNNLKEIIRQSITSIKYDNTDWINTKLDSYIDNIEEILWWEYHYDTWMQRWNTITESDIIEKIIESYFQKRALYKDDRKVSELSAWEKRQALINLVYAFLINDEKRDKHIIIAIDEPENSLHTSLCYDQFEKLQTISKCNQTLVTTHRYWFLPIISQWLSHFLTEWTWNDVLFETYDLYDYKSKVAQDSSSTRNEIPHNFALKSTTDLVHSIFYSLTKEEPYNWLIVEWISEKIYFEYFFKDEILSKKLRILCLWWQSKVSELYEYLELPIKKERDWINWKVFCLIDTDNQRHKEHIWDWYSNLKIRRLSNADTNTYIDWNEKTSLLTLNNPSSTQCDIEQSLNPIIFQKTMENLWVEEKYQVKNIEKEDWNTSFIENFKNLELKRFFNENDWENKIIFAKKYVEIMESIDDKDTCIPERINEIKEYFN